MVVVSFYTMLKSLMPLVKSINNKINCLVKENKLLKNEVINLRVFSSKIDRLQHDNNSLINELADLQHLIRWAELNIITAPYFDPM